MPEPLGKAITECLQIPTIGIGAGRFCDGQVLIIHDLLGITPFQLKFAKRYQQGRDLTLQAIQSYAHDVEEGIFPSDETAFHARSSARRHGGRASHDVTRTDIWRAASAAYS